MSDTLESVRRLVAIGEVRISEHGYDELSDDRIPVKDVLAGVQQAQVVEDYPTYAKGPAVLVLQFDSENRPVHVVWGIPLGLKSPAVLVTAYRPDSERWDETFTERRQ